MDVPRSKHVVLLALVALAAAAARQVVAEQPGEATRIAHPAHRPSADRGGADVAAASLPIAFVENAGQWSTAARFVARRGGVLVGAEPEAIAVALLGERQGALVRLRFADGAEDAVVEGEGQLPTRYGFFLGRDAARWRGEVRGYASVLYRGVREGVDVRIREGEAGCFEYDVLLAPGADLDGVVIQCEGIDGMRVDSCGALVLETAAGELRQPLPVAWHVDAAGRRHEVRCAYRLLGDDRFGFSVEARDIGNQLVIDPGLVWSTFLGSSDDDAGNDVVLGATGDVFVAGHTNSVAFPTTPGAFDRTHNGGRTNGTSFGDAFVARFSASGKSLTYATYLGGRGNERADSIFVDAAGSVVVAGRTNSVNFPVTRGAFDTTHNGDWDGFVARLHPTGRSLVFSSFLGGASFDQVVGLAVDANGGDIVVGGTTSSRDFPTTPGAFDRSLGGRQDGFVARVAATGARLVSSTYLGGASFDAVSRLWSDAQGVVVTGGTSSRDFPVTRGAFDTTLGGLSDAFIARMTRSGALVFATFLGGSGRGDFGVDVATDATFAVTVAGYTDSGDFPTTPGAYDTTHNGNLDPFVVRFAPLGDRLEYSTYLGGGFQDTLSRLALDAGGAATVVGTCNQGFPVTLGAFDTTWNSGDGYVARLSPSGDRLDYSTYLGGIVLGLAIDRAGAATVVGGTSSSGFPVTPGAFDTTYNGRLDGFVTRVDMLPSGVRTFGSSSAGCSGALVIGVTSMPFLDNPGFALTCRNAPDRGTGAVVIGAAGLRASMSVLGIELWVDPNRATFVLPVRSDRRGNAELRLPVPKNPWLVGRQLNAQFVWLGPISPPPCPPAGVSASNAVEVVFQR